MATDVRDLSGQVVDRRYRVEYQLGRGGMGAVWSVQHVESLRHFALKTLESELAGSAEGRDRLLRETRAAGALRSPHVVQVVDARMDYVHDGQPLPYLVMERLDGFTLQHWIETRGPLDPAELFWVLGQIGRALALAHRHGIIHRDLKPSNIFLSVDHDGQLVSKLCDFGIAKLTSSAAAELLTHEARTTATGSVLGTPLYLPPELLRGSGRATSATDQWALGLTAFNALTGQDYFGNSASGPELVLRIAQDPMPRPSELHRGLPPRFDAWFLRSCARAPEQRFASIADQIEGLERALGNPTPRAPLASSSYRPELPPAGRASEVPTRTVPSIRRSRLQRATLLVSAAWAVFGAIFLLAWQPGKADMVPHDLGSARPVEAAPTAQPAVFAAAPPNSAGAEFETFAPPTAAAEPKAAPAPSVAPLRADQRPRNRVLRAAPSARPAAARAPPASGAACRRSAECASGLCVAEQCR